MTVKVTRIEPSGLEMVMSSSGLLYPDDGESLSAEGVQKDKKRNIVKGDHCMNSNL